MTYLSGTWEKSRRGENDPDNILSWRLSDPQHCHLEAFQRHTFCETLAGLSVLVVGDSINMQFYEAIVTAVGYHPKAKACPGAREIQTKI
eukprot:CAMPEP_0168733990 /NCGR_PEP_ID=MMETSP0724-20121128/8580_1 /TAXON_ID=265536 /ORGANISM="Amphiprora sp., Strain CCMP467" /LENGTH=89 /DNA_ID=CAMNT_0008781075 /DNA_START=301 /DNA_END=570 /DNA_ORIENTATION=+